ncbi:MAG: Uma2 family endonuclease [Oscillochloridaceae bacterium umkhey_bin13]
MAVLQPQADDYAQELAQPAAVFLLIEIADTSLTYDREQKIPRYATAHIPEVWLVDVQQGIIEQYTQPFAGQYTMVKKHLRGMTIQSSMLPQIQFSLNDIFKQ